MWMLDQLATVYTPGVDSGFTVVAKANLACRLMVLDRGGGEVGLERAEEQDLRSLLWDPSYEMPAVAQVLISGERWNPVVGTIKPRRGPTGRVLFRRCDVVRAH